MSTDFARLDRASSTLLRPQNEDFSEKSAENWPCFGPSLECTAKGRHGPTVGLVAPQHGRGVCLLCTQGTLQRTPQTLSGLQELTFIPIRHAPIAR